MQNPGLLVELLVEELPPKALKKLGAAFAATLADKLRADGLTDATTVTPYASPRRLAVHVANVAARAPDRPVQHKLMPVAVALDAAGQPTPALLKKLAALGQGAEAVPALKRLPDGKAEALFLDSLVPGVGLAEGLQAALNAALAALPIPKVMSYQLERDCVQPGWSTVQFVRPAHGLVALHGTEVLPVQALGLRAGRLSQGHRFEALCQPLELAQADAYADTMREQGAVLAHYEERSLALIRQLRKHARACGAVLEAERDLHTLTEAEIEIALLEDPLVQEVTALVERPNVLRCQFEPEFLAVPQECLILTMKANQKYFPLLDAHGRLMNQFLVVSNISPDDPSAVIRGNERVVRPRLADAKFFYDQDRKRPLESRVPGLDKVVYHNQLGTQGERVGRVRAIARALAERFVAPARRAAASSYETSIETSMEQHYGYTLLLQQVDRAALLAKADLLTDMVGEFPELQGIMGRYYARHDGEDVLVAEAIEDHYKPRFAGDELPRSDIGLMLALADKLETLVGLFGIGSLPTGERDPYALRRHALGVLRMLIERQLPMSLSFLIDVALPVFGQRIQNQQNTREALSGFIFDRLAFSLRDQGYSALEVEAVLALRPELLRNKLHNGDRLHYELLYDEQLHDNDEPLHKVLQRLDALRAFVALPEAQALAAANKRIGNILKKSVPADQRLPQLQADLLQEPAELALHAALGDVRAQAYQLHQGNYTAYLLSLAQLRAPVDAFFDGVMVNAEDTQLRENRLALLKALYKAMNRVAELARLAV